MTEPAAPTTPAGREPHGIAPYVLQAVRRIQRHFIGQGEQAERGEAFVVGVFGEWGSGKSTVLQAIGRKVVELAEPDVTTPSDTADRAPEATLVVDFNAWRFEREEHLLVPLLKTVQRALNDRLQRLQQAEATTAAAAAAVQAAAAGEAPQMDSIWWTRIRPKLAGARAPSAPSAPPAPTSRWEWLGERATLLGACTIALTRMVKLKAGVPGLGEVELDPAGALKAMQEQVDRARVLKEKAAAGKPSAPPEPPLESLYYDLFGQLQQFTRGPTVDGVAGRLNLVFLIDDLDRCLPEKAVEMLEAIKLFLDVEGCAFVLALDDEVIERGIAHRYRDYLRPQAGEVAAAVVRTGADGDKEPRGLSQVSRSAATMPPITGHEYLEKIVQLPFRLPRWSRPEVRNFVSERWRDALLRWNGPPQSRMDQVANSATPDPWLVDLIVDGVPPVPRNLVRALELLEFTREVVHLRNLDGRLQAYTLAQIVLLQLFAPQCYRFLRREHAQGWRTFERRQSGDRAEVASFPKAAADHFVHAPTRLDDSFFEWWIQLCELRMADPEAALDPYIGSTELPLARLLDEARRNRNGFDARLLFLQGRTGLDVDRDLKPYFSLFDESPSPGTGTGAIAPAATATVPPARFEATPAAQPPAADAPVLQASPPPPRMDATASPDPRAPDPSAFPSAPMTAPVDTAVGTAAPRDREAFVRQLLSASPEAWSNAVSREDQLMGRTLDDTTFEQLRAGVLSLLQSRPGAAPSQVAWLEAVERLLSPVQLRQLVADTGVLAHAARRAGRLPAESAQQGASP